MLEATKTLNRLDCPGDLENFSSLRDLGNLDRLRHYIDVRLIFSNGGI